MRSLHLTLQWRIALLSGLCLLGVVGVLTAASVHQTQNSAAALNALSIRLLEQAAQQRLQAQAAAHGQQVERFFDQTALYCEGFAQQVLLLRKQALEGRLTPQQLRGAIIQAAREALKRRDNVLGLYVILQPDALGATDAGCATGRTSPPMKPGALPCTGRKASLGNWCNKC